MPNIPLFYLPPAAIVHKHLPDGSYLRLKNLELGYKIPTSVMERLKFNSIRVFASGQNLLTFSSEKYIDPEIGVSGASKRARYYFQQKVFTLGLNVNF
jgi:hypothetical protein